MIDNNAVRISNHARFALGEAGVTGGVITKSNEQTDNVSLCSLCPPCNKAQGYRVTTSDWYLAIRARRATPNISTMPARDYRVTSTIYSSEQGYRVTTTK
jgi:hypothetical protein